MNIQTLLAGILKFLDETIVPFLLAVAFLVFVWNIATYFIIGSSKAGNKEKGLASGHERARQYALWGIIAFVIIVSVWGIVNLLVRGLDLRNEPITPDYMDTRNRSKGSSPVPSPLPNPQPFVVPGPGQQET